MAKDASLHSTRLINQNNLKERILELCAEMESKEEALRGVIEDENRKARMNAFNRIRRTAVRMAFEVSKEATYALTVYK